MRGEAHSCKREDGQEVDANAACEELQCAAMMVGVGRGLRYVPCKAPSSDGVRLELRLCCAPPLSGT